MADKQRTIAKRVVLKGKGLHTGLDCTLSLVPAPENHGYKFMRTDMEGNPIIDALVENVVDTSRGTALEVDGVRVGTVEHVLSAVYGMGIDNILIELDAPETPILDGSAKGYVKAIIEAGIEEQEANRDYYIIREPVTYTDKDNKVEMAIYPYDGYSVNVLIDFNSPVVANQFATFDITDNYEERIAPCRTFVFLHELERLLSANMIKGGDLNNAIIIIDRKVTQEELDRLADKFNKPRIEVQPIGILNNLELAFANEPARHKLLDVIGDLALLGKPIKGKIIATRPGHTANYEFTKKLKNLIKKEQAGTLAPYYNMNEDPIMDINQIKKLLPHRPPFLLVDKIIAIGEESIVGVKNVTMNEGFFVGHFPEEPVMPGVLMIEALAQVGGLLVLNSVPDPENYSTYFVKIENVKFKRKVVPGDTLLLSLQYASPMRRGIAHMKGKAFVGNNVVMEGEMMAQIVKNKG